MDDPRAPGTSQRPGSRWGRAAVFASLSLLATPCLTYGGVYAYARASHRLVHYAGGFIARPDAMHGIGFTLWELALAPAAWLEEAARGVLDPTW